MGVNKSLAKDKIAAHAYAKVGNRVQITGHSCVVTVDREAKELSPVSEREEK